MTQANILNIKSNPSHVAGPVGTCVISRPDSRSCARELYGKH